MFMLVSRRCGATLFGIQRNGSITINPGNEMVIDAEDVLFYICLTGEENAQIIQNDLSSMNVMDGQTKANGELLMTKNGAGDTGGGGIMFARDSSLRSTCSLNSNHSKYDHS